MNNIKHFIKGNQTDGLPLNNDSFGVIVDWTGSKEVTVDFDNQKWIGPDAETIIDERANGLGSFVGVPYKLQVDGVNLPEMQLDLRTNYKQIGCNEVEVGVKLVKNKDWFVGEAGVLQLRRLEEEGKFLPSDFVNVPYNINYIPDGMQVLMMSISTYLIAKELITFAKETADSISELTAGTTLVSPAVTAMAVLKIAIRIAYFISMVIAGLDTTQQ